MPLSFQSRSALNTRVNAKEIQASVAKVHNAVQYPATRLVRDL